MDAAASKWDAVRGTGTARAARQDIARQSWNWPWMIALTLTTLWALRWAQLRFVEWRASVLRRENRRRYGIPDDDDRPFHIAYNAAAAARRQRELEKRAQLQEQEELQQVTYPDPASQPSMLQGPAPVSRERHHSQPHLERSSSVQVQPLLGTHASYGALRRRELSVQQPAHLPQQQQEHDWISRYDPNVGLRPPLQPANTHRVVSSRKGVARLDLATNDGKLPDVQRRQHVIGGIPSGISLPALPVKRNHKRLSSDHDGDDDLPASRRGKRAKQNEVAHDEDMADIEDADDLYGSDAMDTDASPSEPPRSTLKRHRSEAASQNGAEEDDARSRKLRKGESVRKAESIPRHPKKRPQREDEDDDDDEDRRKRGRSGHNDTHDDEEDADEVMQEDPPSQEQKPEIQVEPACEGRAIGETWTVDDVQFKVGPEGQRLRLVHLKQMRTKPVKVRDFATNKPAVQIRVVIERWLTDAEFEQAKEKKELAWATESEDEDPTSKLLPVPSAPPAVTEPASNNDSPAKGRGGKLLLWDTPSRRSTPNSTPGGSPTTGSTPSLPNPFLATRPTVANVRGRRVASVAPPSNLDVPTQLRYSRSFSKWEKQEAEAEALEKIRRKEREREAEKARLEEEEKRKADEAKKTSAPSVSFAPAPAPSLFKPSDAASKPTDASKAETDKPNASDVPKFKLTPSTPGLAATSDASASKPPSLFPQSASTTSSAKPSPLGFSLPSNPLSAPLSTSKPSTPGFSFTATPGSTLAPSSSPSPFPSSTAPTSGTTQANPGASGTDNNKPALASADAPKSGGFNFGPLPGSTAPSANEPGKLTFSLSSASSPAPSSLQSEKSLSAFGLPPTTSTTTANPSSFSFGSTPTTAPASGSALTPSTDAKSTPSAFNLASTALPVITSAPTGADAGKSLFAVGTSGSQSAVPSFFGLGAGSAKNTTGPAASTAAPSSFNFPSSGSSMLPAPSTTASPAGGFSFATPPATAGSTATPAPGAGAAPGVSALGRPIRGLRQSALSNASGAPQSPPSAPANVPPPSTGGFSFGSTPAFGTSTAPTTGGFSFGTTSATPSATNPAAPNAFGFGSAATGATAQSAPNPTPGSGFSFSSQSGGAAPSLFGTNPAANGANPLFGGAAPAAPGTPQSNTPFGTPSNAQFTFGKK